MQYQIGSLIGEGERSKVYENKLDSNTIVKVTSHKYEKEVADFFFNNPSDLFVKIFSIEKVGRKYIMVIEKLDSVDFTFTKKDGSSRWYESCFNRWHYKDFKYKKESRDNYIEEVKSFVKESYLVEEYYSFLDKCQAIGMGIFETAFNMGIKDGKFICFDTCLYL